MTVSCRIDDIVINTQDARSCIRHGGVVVPDEDDTRGPACFVRNVLTRTLGSAALDIGWADGVSPEVVDALAISSRATGRRGSSRRPIVRLTPARRRAVTAVVGRSILRLAATYPATLDFRDRLLMTTPRGKQWKRYYDRYLGEIYRVAERNLDLMRDSAVTWLAVYPFVRGMVRVASGRKGSVGAVTFTRKQHRTCAALIARFHKGSKDPSFRRVLSKLKRELAGYAGLTAEQAVARLRKSPARRG